MVAASAVAEPLTVVVWLALATVSIAYTLTKTPVFEWVRDLLPKGEGWAATMLRGLWACPYCMSHWIAFGFVAIFQPKPFTGTWLDLFPVAFIIVTLAGLVIQLISVMSELAGWLIWKKKAIMSQLPED